MTDSTQTETLRDLEDADAYLGRLLDKLFVQRVIEIESRLGMRIDGLERRIDEGLRRLTDEVARSGRSVSKALAAGESEDRKEFRQLRQMLTKIRDQDADAKERTGRILDRVDGNEEADRARDETTQQAVSAVLERVETLGEAEVGRDEVAASVASAVRQDLAGVRSSLEEEVQGALESIDRAISALIEDEQRRAEAAGSERSVLRRWVLAAAATAGFAFVASVVAIVSSL